tara:strand:- start:681 stop:887 length:207 start_codon:yes stop_codon:yes gene_type:complete
MEESSCSRIAEGSKVLRGRGDDNELATVDMLEKSSCSSSCINKRKKKNVSDKKYLKLLFRDHITSIYT